MKHKLITTALFGAFAIPCLAFADDSTEIMIVTPTRTSQSPDKTISDTTVLSSKDIQDSQAPDLPSLLKDVAGIEIVQTGGIGHQSSLFMRGTNSDHVLVLVDGVRIDSATTGTTALDQLMLDQIDHIEIVRGNASSLYGSSAIGGVIQIFTKHGAGKPSFTANVGAGSYNTKRAAAGFGGQSGSTNFDLQLSRFKTDGVSAINPVLVPTANPDQDGYSNTSLSASVRHAFNSDHSLSASAFQSRGNIQFDNAYNMATTDINTSTTSLSKFSLASDNHMTEMWRSKLQWSEGVDDSKTYLNGAPDPYGYYYQTVNRQLSWQNNLALDANNSLLLGAERLRQTVSSDTVYSQAARSSNSLFGGYTGAFSAHQVQLNLRQDRYSDFGTVNTGLLGYGYSLNQLWRATISYSTAFKAPTFNDLYAPVSWGSNPDLKPERSHNTDVGLHYVSSGQHVNLVYFNNLVSNLIAYSSAFKLININRARVDGTELSYSGQFDNTGISASLTSQNPRDANTGEALLRRAKLHGSIGLTQKLGDWQTGVEWIYSGTRQDMYSDPVTFTTTRKTLASYNVFNLTASYAFSKEIKMSLRADNLTNQNDSGVYGYNPLGRRLFISLNLQQ